MWYNICVKNNKQPQCNYNVKQGKMVRGGTIVDATIISAPESTRNAEGKRDPEMHSVRKGTKWYFGMRVHIGTDPIHGFVHSLTATASNAVEVKQAPDLVRLDDEVVYGDAGYCKMERYVRDGKERRYEINRQKHLRNCAFICQRY